jgi:transcriptional regulator with XRE-family HTH domain
VVDQEEERRKKQFGARLKEALNADGVKQEALATKLGVDQSTVSLWVNGQHVPGAPTRRRIEKELPSIDEGELERILSPEAIRAAARTALDRRLDELAKGQRAMLETLRLLVETVERLGPKEP